MKLPRREFLHLAAGAAMLPALSRGAWAETYPARPVKLIVPYNPGGPTDVSARLVSQWLSQRLGQTFDIEHRPGADTNVGTESVVRAPADGHTLLVVNPANAINVTLYGNLPFNFMRDIAPVAGLITTPFVVAINPSLPPQSIPEFIAYAKANPGKIKIASPGSGTQVHCAEELFKMMAGVDMVHAPYLGLGRALPDLFAGQVHGVFIDMLTSIPHIKAGKLRALAVTSATRSSVFPELPTVGDFVPGYAASTWFGVGAPKSTPTEIVDKLNLEINAGLADPAIKARFAEFGGTTIPGAPADFGKFVADETEKWGRVVKAVGIKPD